MRLAYVFAAAIGLPLTSCGPSGGATATGDAAASVPNLSGLWAREYIGYDFPASGDGPILNLSRIPTGQSNLDEPVGDYNNPILTPAAAQVLKSRGEMQRTGKNFPQPSNQCVFHPTPYILYAQQIALLQQMSEVVILYQHPHQARHIRLNGQHAENVTRPGPGIPSDTMRGTRWWWIP